jgi:threonine/homoserine/homoserine lactone efflux protein
MQYAVLAVIIAVSDFFVLMLYATLGSRAAKLLAGPNAMWIDRLYGIALLGLSSFLMLQSFGHF